MYTIAPDRSVFWLPVFWLAGLLVALGTLLATAAYAAPAPIEGLWLTQDRDGVIRIAPCPTGLCGWIVGVKLAPGKPPPTNFQGKPNCGLKLIDSLQPSDPGVWKGDITNPRDGKVYDSRLSVDAQGQLRLRGYVLVPLFGQTQTWTRYAGKVTPDCRMSGS